MKQNLMLKKIGISLEKAKSKFRDNPKKFFTESDIRYLVVRELEDQLKGQNKPYGLVHTEYPTPFKCAMDGKKCVCKKDNEKSHRGHYDIVVLNPNAFSASPQNIVAIRGQSFNNEKFREIRDTRKPLLLYAIELMRIKSNTKNIPKGGVRDGRCDEISQDLEKIRIGCKHGYIKGGKMLVWEINPIDKNISTPLKEWCKSISKKMRAAKAEYITYPRNPSSNSRTRD